MLDRRGFLQVAAVGAIMPLNAEIAANQAPGLIAREVEPPNLESPLAALAEHITPNDAFFVRNHFATPKIDLATWRLKVEGGAVQNPLTWSYQDVLKQAASTRTVTLECAGNGRVFLTPKVRGVNWQNGAVGNAEWKGVPLAAVLDVAGVKSTAVEVILEGADVGAVNDDPKSPGPIAFSRSLPLAKARRPEVLLAYQMNGHDLTPEHGWPLRAIVGGWYGMASVKWLTRIIVTDRPYQGFWQTLDYSYFDRTSGLPTLAPIQAMQVKTVVLRPVAREVIPVSQPFRIHGQAWAGENAVAKVEISDDGGTSWAEGKLQGRAEPFVWTNWIYEWKPATAGNVRLLVRATDTAGRSQPLTRDADRRTYMVNHVVPVEVMVR